MRNRLQGWKLGFSNKNLLIWLRIEKVRLFLVWVSLREYDSLWEEERVRKMKSWVLGRVGGLWVWFVLIKPVLKRRKLTWTGSGATWGCRCGTSLPGRFFTSDLAVSLRRRRSQLERLHVLALGGRSRVVLFTSDLALLLREVALGSSYSRATWPCRCERSLSGRLIHERLGLVAPKTSLPV